MGDLFSGIFGKGGGGDSTPPPMPQAPDMSGQMMAMNEMMMSVMNGMMNSTASMMEHMGAQAQAQQESMMASLEMNMPGLPDVYRDPTIDWTEAQGQLNQKAKADFHADQMRRKGRTDTILTSPLLDDEEANVTGSILTGEG